MVGDEGQGPGWTPWVAPGEGSGEQPPVVRPAAPVGPPPPAWAPRAGYGYGPPPGPPVRQRRTGLIVLLVAGSLVVVGAAVAGLASVMGDDDEEAGEAGGGDGGGFDDADPADAVSIEVPDDYVEATGGDVTVQLPDTWRWAELEGDAAGVGEQLAPDDPELAEDFDNRMRTLPRTAVLVGLDEDDLDVRQFNTNVVVLQLTPGLPDEPDAMRAVIERELGAQGADFDSVSYVDSAEGPALRVRYRMTLQGVEVGALQYWYSTSDGPYTLSVTSDDLDDHIETADAMAASLTLAG